MQTTVCYLFVICAAFGWCAALDCYSCLLASGCGDPFDPASATTKTCSNGSVCSAQSIRSGGNNLYSRDCVEADSCSPGCLATAEGMICSYCCDDEDLCNRKAIADEIASILHCYVCAYSSDPSSANISSSGCNDPFDPTDTRVIQLPCPDGKCGVINTTFGGHTAINRLCFPNAQGGCTPGCASFNCYTCCSTNLCNGGSEGGVATTPSAAPSLEHFSLLRIVLIGAGLCMVVLL